MQSLEQFEDYLKGLHEVYLTDKLNARIKCKQNELKGKIETVSLIRAKLANLKRNQPHLFTQNQEQ